MPDKVAIIDSDYPSDDVEEKELATAGVTVVRGPSHTEQEIIALAHDADGLLVQYASITRQVIESLERCRIITRFGVGVDTIDVEAATEHGIYVANVPDYCMDEVSDHALALLLACARKVVSTGTAVRRGEWNLTTAIPIIPLRGAILGLIGYGRIPRTLAPKAQALGMDILAHDPYLSDEVIRESGAEPAALEELLRRSDFVSLHAPLSKDTQGMVGAPQLRLMKRNSYLINTSRGGLVDEDALYRALSEKWIAGAALDVLVQEPPAPSNLLLPLENCIVTPHIAWYSEHSYLELRRRAAQEVARVLSGAPPRSAVNREVVPRA